MEYSQRVNWHGQWVHIDTMQQLLSGTVSKLQLAQRKAAAPRFAAAALSDEPTITPISSVDGQVEVTQRLNPEELAALGTFSAAEELPPKAQNWPWLTAP